jgi:hypothetical protein
VFNKQQRTDRVPFMAKATVSEASEKRDLAPNHSAKKFIPFENLFALTKKSFCKQKVSLHKHH